MFTGIIEAVGTVQSVQPQGGDVRLMTGVGHLDMGDVKLGDSIATNGICLTVVAFGRDWYAADVSVETLNRATLKYWRSGTRVNLEKALLPTRDSVGIWSAVMSMAWVKSASCVKMHVRCTSK